jgi:hypothetical protein
MGVADFPVELIKAFKPKPASTTTDKTAALDEDDVPSPAGGSPSPPKYLASNSQSQLSSSSGSQSGPVERSASTDQKSEQSSSSPAAKETKKQFDPSAITLESAIGASKGISRVVGAGMKSPMDFTLGLARGFHNAPKLYGDDTVRPQERVTGFQSGLRAAGKVCLLLLYSLSYALHSTAPIWNSRDPYFHHDHCYILGRHQDKYWPIGSVISVPLYLPVSMIG